MKAVALVCLALVGACAKHPDSIQPRCASASGYRGMECQQLNDERMRVGSELERIRALQRENANTDAAMMGVGLIIFWPALIGLAATTDRSETISAMMGERDAMDLAAREKACPAVTIPVPAVTPAPPPAAT